MAYTKYSLTPADNNAAAPNGAPEGMLPSAVNDTMRDMMSQIRDVGDGIRGGTYTMTAPVITGGSITGVALSGNTLTSPIITGGSINNTTVGATTASTGAFTTLSASSTVSGTGFSTYLASPPAIGGTVAAAGNFTTLGASSTATLNTLASSGATLTGGSVNNMAVGDTTRSTGAFTTLTSNGATTFTAGTASTTTTTGAVVVTGGVGVSGQVTATTFAGALSGNATTATTLATTRAINGTNFNGSADITTANWGTSRTIWGQSINGSANITAPLLPAAGTVSAPAFSTSGDTNTGIFFPAADTIAFAEGGAESMRIDSSGNVGIGTTTPSYKLEVNGSNPTAAVRGNALTDSSVFNAEASDYTTSFRATRITQYGSSATGTTFGLSNASLGHITFQNTSAGAIATNNATPLVFATDGTERMRIDSSGNLLLAGTATPATGVGTIAIFNGTAPTASVTNGIVLYAEDVSSSSELKVRDEAGNVTTLSPHNFSMIPEGASEDMAWAHYSEKNGKRINVDMLKLARMVEKLTGEKLVYTEKN